MKFEDMSWNELVKVAREMNEQIEAIGGGGVKGQLMPGAQPAASAKTRLEELYEAAQYKYKVTCNSYNEGQVDAYDRAIQIVDELLKPAAGVEPVAWLVSRTGGGVMHAAKYTADQARRSGYCLPVYAAPVSAEPVYQFRKEGCANWYDGHPDNSDGGGPYEVRTLYTAPVAPVSAEPVAWRYKLTKHDPEWTVVRGKPTGSMFEVEPLYVSTVAAQAQQKKIKALESEVSGLRAARIAYASEFPPDAEGDPDVGNIHANIRKLKAQAQLEKGCKRSHPHENMSPECEALTEEARIANQAAQAQPLPDSLVPTATDLEYLRGVVENTALPAFLRGQIAAAVKALAAQSQQPVSGADGLLALVDYLRQEADFNRSWTDGRRGSVADKSPDYITRRQVLAARADTWADAVARLISTQPSGNSGQLDQFRDAAQMIEPSGNSGELPLPVMRSAFWITEQHGHPDPKQQKFLMLLKFKTAEEMNAAHNEWMEFKYSHAALAQQDADKEDAERYRWLRNPAEHSKQHDVISWIACRTREDLDAAIDAARKEQA